MIGSLPDVFPSVGASVGVDGWSATLDLPEARAVVVLLIDGLGYENLAAHAELAPYLAGLLNGPALECGVPSTTATSLTSLGTGLPPGQHGVVGYTCRIPGTGRRLNALHWDRGVEPEVWQPHRTVLERLRDGGVNAVVVNAARFVDSGLTRCSQRGVPYIGADQPWERLDAILDVVEQPGKHVVYAYESALDHTGHQHGCGSAAWRTVLSAIDAEVRRLRDELPDDTTLVVTADHGMIDVPVEDRFDLDTVPTLRDDVVMIAGEARLRHVYTLDGAAASVAQRWAGHLGERASVVTREEAEAAGWFGIVDPAVRPRIGDVLVAARDDFAVFSGVDAPQEFQMVGFHGSITAVERRIPWLVDR